MWLRLFLHWMKSANQEEIDRILDEAIKRRKELFPGWDMMYIALPKEDLEERKRILEYILYIEGKQK